MIWSKLMKRPTKHELVKGLESNITSGDQIAPTHWTDMTTGFIVNVIGYVRKLKTSFFNTFEELCTQFLTDILEVCKNASRIDFIFD